MRGVNKAILIGNATCDGELRHTQNSKAVSSIRVTTNRRIKVEEANSFHSTVGWDRRAERHSSGHRPRFITTSGTLLADFAYARPAPELQGIAARSAANGGALEAGRRESPRWRLVPRPGIGAGTASVPPRTHV